jgi:formate hydrogenlyase transcriptional activator
LISEIIREGENKMSAAIANPIVNELPESPWRRREAQRPAPDPESSTDSFFKDIVGNSPAIQKVLEQVTIVGRTNATVLLHGETGTGKELIAQAIHKISARRAHTFVRMNCAAIPAGLLESELFGHEKGAFTGALMQKKGRFELADGGSLLLDEIGDISLELQPKLLRAVQEQEFERLGSARTLQVNVRMIAATHRDLAAMIREDRFREDLFYRLNVFPIEIPPLRERREDIPQLINYFVSKLSIRMQKDITSVPRHAMQAMTNHAWRGNVRELANFVERAVILSQGEELQVPLEELQACDARGIPSSSTLLHEVPSSSTFLQAQRDVIIDALKVASGQISGNGGAAERLGLKRTTLQNKMRRLNICRADYAY